MKSKRQKEILRIISEINVETQDQLLNELRGCGIQATQATISRDIKELHLVKVPAGNGMYRYAQVARKHDDDLSDRLQTIFRHGVTSFDRAQNIVVVKTMPGLASAAAAALDGMNIEDLVGSLAGDDTALLIMRSNEAADEFCIEIREMLQ